MHKVLQLTPEDNVAVVIKSDKLALVGQKVALEQISINKPIIKYGCVIGFAKRAIDKDEVVDHRNIVDPEEIGVVPIENEKRFCLLSEERRHFFGYKNSDGSVGTRNYLCIMSSVQCVSGILEYVVDRINKHDLHKYKNVDGIIAINHAYGCGVAIDAVGSEIPKRTISNLLANPNFGNRALIVGLGCEKLKHEIIINELRKATGREMEVKSIYLQDITFEGFYSATETLTSLIHKELDALNNRKREKVSISNLLVGMQCGGSDAFSGITANPLLGHLSDILIAAGGSTIFSENTECMDAEVYLKERCLSSDISAQLSVEFDWYRDYLSRSAVDRTANTTPGNKSGGLSTIAEKALGSVAKSGSAQIAGVIKPGERCINRGLNYLSGPASDFICGTLQLAAGSNFHIFTTGRGTPYSIDGFPVLKVSSNSKLKHKWFDLIDFDAGSLLDSGDFHNEALKLLDLIIKIASGDKTCAEKLGIKNDIVLFNPAPVT